MSNGEVVFGRITRFGPKKNQEFIIDTFKIINSIILNTRSILGGPDGGQLKYMVDKVNELKLE